LSEAQPDVACLQEIKCVDEKFPREAFEQRGYNCAVLGQKSYNGVALLSKTPLEDVRRGLPGDETDEQSRYIEAVTGARHRSGGLHLPAQRQSDWDGEVRYKLAWMERLRLHAGGAAQAGGSGWCWRATTTSSPPTTT
jgi:exodeoxyribonuclease-3